MESIFDAQSLEKGYTLLTNPIKGKADWREFRCFQLDNGVTVCLVHDKESKTTAAAACVEAGAAGDPRSLSGLAHFCEHMCFLGSEKYPGENEYKRYLSQHGGRSNASTSLYMTTYKFEIIADYAEHALDIFSNFFVSPLFTESGTGREVHAVDSENSKNLTADERRRLQILKALADPEHYFSKFTTGNANTIPTDENLEEVREALLAFHRIHYRPDKLTVVVAGPQTLDELEKWVVPRFASMRARDFPDSIDRMTPAEKLVHEAAHDAPLISYKSSIEDFRSPFDPKFQAGKWPVLLTTKPLRAVRRLTIMFPLPPVYKIPDKSPVSVLSHLLGHEGPNSPFATLQDEGLLSTLSAGSRTSAPDFNLFHVDIGLTEEGEARWKEVVDVIFQHCRVIREAAQAAASGESEELQRIWEESIRLSAMFFDQSSPGSVYDLAPSLAGSIVKEGTEMCLSAGASIKESRDTFPAKQVADFASRLVPHNCIIERCSETAWEEMDAWEQIERKDGPRFTEKWYGIDYFLTHIDDEDVRRWSREQGSKPFFAAPSLQLPRPNRYIPRTLELCPDLPEEARQGPRITREIQPPNLLMEDENVGRLWHRLDDRYALPKAVVTLLLRNAAVNHTRSGKLWEYNSSSAVKSSLLSGMFSQALAQETYDADLAGLSWGLSMTTAGIQVTCRGFSDRLPDLTLKVLEEFFKGDFIKESYFHTTKDRALRSLKNYLKSGRADAHALYYRDLLMASNDEGLDVSIVSAEAVTFESILEYHKELLGNDETYLECLYSGNVSEVDAMDFFQLAAAMYRQFTPATKKPQFWNSGIADRRVAMGDDLEIHFASKNEQEENGGILVTYQSHQPGYRGRALSTEEHLRNTAAVRLLCQIIREPLFDELRTKQTLGYIVSSYYDVGFSSAPCTELLPWTVPVDYIVVSILSRKIPPREILKRIDSFMHGFRDTLQQMPESEIKHHAAALSTTLLKPIQKLNTEASNHFSKIKYFVPEVFANGFHANDVPWSNAEAMANTVRSVTRKDLISTWDRMILPGTRSRIVSCVYGTTFPLQKEMIQFSSNRKAVVVESVSDLLKLRSTLPIYDRNATPDLPLLRRLQSQLSANRRTAGLAAIAIAGAGLAAWTLVGRGKKASK